MVNSLRVSASSPSYSNYFDTCNLTRLTRYFMPRAWDWVLTTCILFASFMNIWIYWFWVTLCKCKINGKSGTLQVTNLHSCICRLPLMCWPSWLFWIVVLFRMFLFLKLFLKTCFRCIVLEICFLFIRCCFSTCCVYAELCINKSIIIIIITNIITPHSEKSDILFSINLQ